MSDNLAKDKPNKKARVRLNMISALPSNALQGEGLTTDPIIYKTNEIVEVDSELARTWTTEKYRQCPTKMCERKGGDFLPPEYISRATYA
ncbi:MAG: hypothetical protein QG673_2024 [Pseudomonadota bacterium]|nr:hypothetical protein [Pseudomonadota bacterium]